MGRNGDVKGFLRGSQRNEEHVFVTSGNADPCCRVAKNLGELCSRGLWKVSAVGTECGYSGEISKLSVEGTAWFLLTVNNKSREER